MLVCIYNLQAQVLWIFSIFFNEYLKKLGPFLNFLVSSSSPFPLPYTGVYLHFYSTNQDTKRGYPPPVYNAGRRRASAEGEQRKTTTGRPQTSIVGGSSF